jgi:rSAM/selenodomain-associated transferase 2/rSAM/selenodomain-associated transferase 1
MLKYPRPGTVKTRLIPALGAARACDLYRELVRHTLKTIRTFSDQDAEAPAIEVRLTGAPDATAGRAWLGGAVDVREQGDGDLGTRMERATRAAFVDGMESVVVIGADCPQLSAVHLATAFAALRENDLVLGPAEDGGYYLIGLRAPRPELFRDIAWSTEHVFRQTLAAAQSAGLGWRLLEPLSDVDSPHDLGVWARTPAAQQRGLGRVSVIIPTLNEARQLPRTLEFVQRGDPLEIIVVDGGSTDGTREVARAQDAIALSDSGGRAMQLNRGAAAATGEWLLFLHADTRLPPDYVAHVRRTLTEPGVIAGAFAFGIAEDFAGRRWIERATNIRARRCQLPYGDQALFLRNDSFRAAGGFREMPIMEDYDLVCRLRRQGRIAIAPAVALTSGRRWREKGAVRTTLLNQLIVLGYHLGVAPARLARWYRGGTAKGNSPVPGIAVPPATPKLG